MRDFKKDRSEYSYIIYFTNYNKFKREVFLLENSDILSFDISEVHEFKIGETTDVPPDIKCSIDFKDDYFSKCIKKVIKEQSYKKKASPFGTPSFSILIYNQTGQILEKYHLLIKIVNDEIKLSKNNISIFCKKRGANSLYQPDLISDTEVDEYLNERKIYYRDLKINSVLKK